MAEKELLLSVKGLQKTFGEHVVLKGVDLDVYKGDVKEGVKGGKYSFYESDSRSGITSFEHSAKEALNASGPGDYISYTIPPGKFTLFLTQEIQPAPREALEATKEDWAELFKKYNLKMNLK